jgi:hypothetical protein
MPRFHFHLRARGRIHRDPEGTELPDLAAAKDHAVAVAGELMRGDGTRHWSMSVDDERGGALFDLYFADLDPRLASCSPQVRMLASQTCLRLGALTDVLCAARATRTESRRLLARATGRPQLVYAKGE